MDLKGTEDSVKPEDLPENKGKIKVLDHILMLKKLNMNETVQNFCTNDLKKKKIFSKNTVVLMSNFSFLLRISAIHFILVALPFMPGFQLSLLLMLEIGYLATNVTKYMQQKHIKSLVLLIPKVFQSAFLFLVEFTFFVNYQKLKNKKFAFTAGTQRFLVKTIMYGTFAEYGFLIINISYMVYILFLEKKK
jgi:hypothetical protein